ncbi:MAG: ATP-binding protein [Chloroflexota bacterium]
MKDTIETVHSQAASLQSEQAFQRVVEQLTDGVALLNKRGQIILWNQACEFITGLTREQVIDQPLWQIGHMLAGVHVEPGEAMHRMREIVLGILEDRTTSVKRYEMSYWVAERHLRSLQISIFPVRTDKSRLIGVVLRDISDYQQAQAQRQAHERYLTLLHDITETALAAPDVTTMLNSLAQRLVELIWCDACMVLLWDTTEQKFLRAAFSRGVSASLNGALAGSCEEGLACAALETQKSIVIDDLSDASFASHSLLSNCTGGGMLAVPLLAGTQKLGAALFTFRAPHVFMTDEVAQCEHACRLTALTVSKALLIEEARQRAEEFETIAQVTRSMRQAHTRAEILPVILEQVLRVFDMDGAAFLSRNVASEEILVELGKGRWESWTGMRIPEGQGISGVILSTGQVFRSNNLSAEEMCAYPEKTGGIPYAVGIPLIVQDKATGILWVGSERPISEKLVRVFSTIGDAVASAIHRQSLHEDLQTQLEVLRVTQARLVQSEKLAAIGQLIAGVAHEVNNPLTSILLQAQLLHQQISSDEALRDLERIVSEARRAANTVRGLLDFSRQRATERKPTQINDIIHASLDLVAYELNAHHICWETHLAPDLPLTLADPYQIQQVLINLINNAWQAISAAQANGRLAISTWLGASTFWGSNAKKDTQPQPMIHIQLSDDGPGISEEAISRIFDPFFTTKPEGMGTGLGLSICHGIINEHKGHIWVESAPQQGTTFFIELPVVMQQESRPAEAALARAELQAPTAGRILLIDDEASVLEVLSRMLRRKGYHVDTAGNGTAGLASLFKFRHDLILSDIRMPELNGPEFYQQVKAKDPALAQRIVFTTGDTVNADIRRFLDETQAPFLSKPFEIDELLAQIQQTIAAAQAG